MFATDNNDDTSTMDSSDRPQGLNAWPVGLNYTDIWHVGRSVNIYGLSEVLNSYHRRPMPCGALPWPAAMDADDV